MSVPLRPLRWLYRIPLLLLALAALALAAVLLAACLAGARVQGVSWQQGGLFIERWQLLRRDCEPWHGERLLLAASWPLTFLSWPASMALRKRMTSEADCVKFT